jgi:hypothetical protein
MRVNTVHALAALLLVALLAPFVFVIWGGLPSPIAFEVSGIAGTAIGTLWLAAGVYVSSKEIRTMTAGSRKQAIKNLKGAIATASHHVLIGAGYTLLGALLLMLSVLGHHLHWR